MKKYTDKDLFEFVYRADNVRKICAAEEWLTRHRDLIKKDEGLQDLKSRLLIALLEAKIVDM